MGLFKWAAIAAVGVSLLPADPAKQEQLYARAAAAATWTLTFCDRNAETCEKASTLWAEFSRKAEFGIKLASDVIRKNENDASSPTSLSAPANFETVRPPHGGTLTPHDLKPAWRGKTANKAGI